MHPFVYSKVKCIKKFIIKRNINIHTIHVSFCLCMLPLIYLIVCYEFIKLFSYLLNYFLLNFLFILYIGFTCAAVRNVISILISSDFLQMGKLVHECLVYVRDNLSEIVKIPMYVSMLLIRIVYMTGAFTAVVYLMQ